MKKTVFLFILFLGLLTTINTTQASENIETYSFEGFKIIITQTYENSHIGFSIEKTGLNSFYKIIGEEDKNLYINGVIEYQSNFVIYGYAHVDNEVTYYDSFFLVIDEFGETVKMDFTDYGALEEIVGVYELSDILVINIAQSIRNEPSPLKVKNIFVSYDSAINKITENEVINEFLKVTATDTLLLLNEGYDNEFEYGLNSNLEVIGYNYDLGIVDNAIYNGSVYLEFINEIKINANIYNEPFLLDYPGYYQIITDNKAINFTVKPIISGVTDNLITNKSVTINVSSGNVMLNEDLYLSGETISHPGNYELIVNGANNYIEVYNFIITSNLEGVVNNHNYVEEVVINFNGDGYLNNRYIESGEIITDEGDYILKINGANNYLETYFFTIDYEEDQTSLLDFFKKADIFILIIVLGSGGVILMKSKKS